MTKVTSIVLYIVFFILGCSQENQRIGDSVCQQTEPAGLEQDKVSDIANKFKQKWIVEHPADVEQIGNAAIREITRTETGWHIVFEQVTFPGQPEGESHHFLHVYIDSTGHLEKIVRGPDVIS